MAKVEKGEIKTYPKKVALEKMNQYGESATPFLFIIDYEMDRTQVYPLDAVPAHIHYDIRGRTNSPTPADLDRPPISMTRYPIDQCEYAEAFDQVMQHIRYGNTFLLNLAFPTPVDCNLSLLNIYHRSQARYRLCIEDYLVCFSPEIFVQIRDGQIASYPMKGTIDARLPNAAQTLLADAKEAAEHATIVDLIRNDLSMVARDVRVSKYRYLDRLETNIKSLYQTSSEVVGQLPENYAHRIGSILFDLLPAGSISGAPKPKTLDIIASAEGEMRGYYTGIFGLFDGQNLDSGVMIRYMEKKGQTYQYRSGGGITFRSDMDTEYQEMIDKVYVPII